MTSVADHIDLQQHDNLDPAQCRRARLSRDPRFDGEFFLGVSSTGIYCRPICPARLPAERNVTYFRYAAQAAVAGYRPCLRCRPETAPHSPAWLGSRTTVLRAMALIRSGALNGDGTLEALSQRLGVGERYLRKLFQRELGVSPLAIAQHQRLLLSRQLLVETSLPLTEVAFAAGFGSVRRFNSAIRSAYGVAPGQLRRRVQAPESGAEVSLLLGYRPPYDWDAVVDFLGRHAVAGVEQVSDGSYQRHCDLDGTRVLVSVSHEPARAGLRLKLAHTRSVDLMSLVARLRRMFDLDANPASIHSALGQAAPLAPLLAARPGMRVPGHWSAEEAAVRAIVGQQVSVAAARGVLARLAAAVDSNGLFPRAAQLAQLPDSAFPMPGRRRDALRALAAVAPVDADALSAETLADLKGVGPWTVALFAMRGLSDPDVFPRGDLGLVNAWRDLGGGDSTALMKASQSWAPWRSYAANLLWSSLS